MKRAYIAATETCSDAGDLIRLQTFVGFPLGVRARGVRSPLVLDEYQPVGFEIQTDVGLGRTSNWFALRGDGLSDEILFEACWSCGGVFFLRSTLTFLEVSSRLRDVVVCWDSNLMISQHFVETRERGMIEISHLINWIVFLEEQHMVSKVHEIGVWGLYASSFLISVADARTAVGS